MNPEGSQSRFPSVVLITSERWPMATGGSAPMPVRPGSISRTCTRCPAADSSASVVQRWPAGGTHCRSSAQITQIWGSSPREWLPQVAHTALMFRKHNGSMALRRTP